MQLKVNNTLKSYDSQNNFNLKQLIDLELKDKQKGIAVAVNDLVIPAQKWEQTIIHKNDEILIIKATQGG
ncbi:MAG: sulfur carrier protein ThiS [Bacteroidetes bacterium]|nr:sulfur carrier protein ThiS [Bacteroidota bacterium]